MKRWVRSTIISTIYVSVLVVVGYLMEVNVKFLLFFLIAGALWLATDNFVIDGGE